MTDPISIIQYASDLLDGIINFIPKLIAFASITAAFLPPVTGASWLSKIHLFINMAAFNFKEAKNKGSDQ
jgi:flagellar biosynthesis protein FliQ